MKIETMKIKELLAMLEDDFECECDDSVGHVCEICTLLGHAILVRIEVEELLAEIARLKKERPVEVSIKTELYGDEAGMGKLAKTLHQPVLKPTSVVVTIREDLDLDNDQRGRVFVFEAKRLESFEPTPKDDDDNGTSNIITGDE